MYSERTLMISGSEKGLDSVTSFLKACGCGSVAVISSGSEARRMIPHDDFDLILINTPLKDEFGHQLAVKLCESTCSGVILICKADLAEEMTNRTSDYGVCVVPKPLNKQELLQAIRTKRYPMARLRRILLHILLDIRTADIQNFPAYVRILEFNDTGREILRDSKNKRLLPFSHSLAELAHTSPEAGRCAALESQATDIYQLARPVIGQGESDFRRKIVTSGGSHHAEEEK